MMVRATTHHLQQDDLLWTDIGFSLNQGYHFGGPYYQDYPILGSILGSLYFGKLPHGWVDGKLPVQLFLVDVPGGELPGGSLLFGADLGLTRNLGKPLNLREISEDCCRVSSRACSLRLNHSEK